MPKLNSAPRPTISVVVPLYNHARYVGAALESVLDQTSFVDEIIVIDDGSTDGGIARVEAVLSGYANARVYRQPNRGAHATLNTLVRLSRCEYVAVLNSDDVFMPGKLARCHKIIAENPGVGLICGVMELFDSENRKITEGAEIDWQNRARAFYEQTGLRQLALLNENSIATTSNMVFLRSFSQDIGGFQNLRYCHDMDFLMMAFAHTTVVIDDAQTHIHYRVHPGNTIKENARKVRLELAAVIAATLCNSGQRLLGGNVDSKAIRAFHSFIRRKGLAEVIVLLQTLYTGFSSRQEYYDFIRAPELHAALLSLVEAD